MCKKDEKKIVKILFISKNRHTFAFEFKQKASNDLVLFIHFLKIYIMEQTINRKEFYNYTLTINTPCRAQWEKGVEFYTHFLAERFNDNYLPENIEMKNIIVILLNGAENWHQFAWGGCGQVYNEEIATTLLTPSQRKRITLSDTFRGYSLLDLEAHALAEAASRVLMWAKRFANKS